MPPGFYNSRLLQRHLLRLDFFEKYNSAFYAFRPQQKSIQCMRELQKILKNKQKMLYIISKHISNKHKIENSFCMKIIICILPQQKILFFEKLSLKNYIRG